MRSMELSVGNIVFILSPHSTTRTARYFTVEDNFIKGRRNCAEIKKGAPARSRARADITGARGHHRRARTSPACTDITGAGMLEGTCGYHRHITGAGSLEGMRGHHRRARTSPARADITGAGALEGARVHHPTQSRECPSLMTS